MNTKKIKTVSKTSATTKVSATSTKWENYLLEHRVKPGLAPTHTRISGGSYHIPDEELTKMMSLYWEEIVKPGRTDSLTEKQRSEGGPLLIDMDFRYPTGSKRLYTQDHIVRTVKTLYEIIYNAQDMDGDDLLRCYVLEKPEPFDDNGVVKDGLHFIMDLKSTLSLQKYVRQEMLALLPNRLSDLTLSNDWETVLDDSIARGSTNWQLYGSSKPGRNAYRLTSVYKGSEELKAPDGTFAEFMAMSARMVERPSYDPSLHFNQWLLKQPTNDKKPVKKNLSIMESILSVRNKEQWSELMKEWLAGVSYEWRIIHETTMALPETYYQLGKGTRERWISTCWALRNTAYGLLPVWIDFSAQATGFTWSYLPELLEHWEQGYGQGNAGLTKKSIMYWCKQDAPEKYKEIAERDIEPFIEQCAMNPTHEDIARILHKLYRNEFICTKGSLWYEFRGHRWAQSDNGYGLRRMVSELRSIYKEKRGKIIEMLRDVKPVIPNGLETGNTNTSTNQTQTLLDMSMNPMQEYKPEQLLLLNKKYQEMYNKLGDTNMKNNIMKEASQLFYDGDFIGKLDESSGVLCFKNGIADFENGVFRAGVPDDYISMSTHIDYIPMNCNRVHGHVDMVFNPAIHQPIVDDIHDFMSKIYPDAELREYMWQHLASALTGAENQNFNIYIGKGSNGKSVLTKLMADILGDYKRDVPLTLITEKRQKVGGVAPEIAELKGVRYAVMQESSKGDTVNEGVLKQLTSGTDTIQGRGLYNPAPTRFVPQFKLVMCTNELLDIRSMDGGTWRRMRVVPHMSRFVDSPDPNPEKYEYKKLSETEIKKKMTPLWKQLFVSLLVEKAFETKGIVQDCRIVMEASNAYKARQDLIGTFVNEELIDDTNAYVKKEKLIAHFKVWWERTQNGKCSKKDELWTYMEAKYGKYEKKGWRGARINITEDEDDEDDM